MNKYRILTANSDGTEGPVMGLAQQKRLALKEKVMFYTDETRVKLAFTFRAEKIMDFHGRFFVEDGNGKLLGMFKKEFKSSLVNSTWKVLDTNGADKYIVRESNETLAILRRFADYMPIVGELLGLVLMFFKYHFNFIDVRTGEVVGYYKKTTLFRDHYVLLANDEFWDSNDWRVVSAVCVALDALQSR